MTTPPHALVVGSGIAGMTAALHARRGGCQVTLVCKGDLGETNTRAAQGGIASALFAGDSPADHASDTIAASAGTSDPDAVRALVDDGPVRVRELIDLGVEFDRGVDGALVRGLEAAHSFARVVHAGGDATGLAIQLALIARIREAEIEVLERTFLVDVVCGGDGLRRGGSARGGGGARRDDLDSRVMGAELLVDGERVVVAADAVVLATGGAGQLYAHTTNPPIATGDGVAAAIRAGAEVADLEFVQFHPTVLAEGEPFLVSEAVRGEGATLIDDAGRRFAFDAHPDGELAPRDVVARTIANRMSEQGGRPVLLDATGLRSGRAACARFLAERFPTIDAAVRERGLDWSREPIPVTPAAHYVMGGVVTDLEGRTTVNGLYAVGEVARTGVHGANRLASNSLLEGAVFGARAGDAIVRGEFEGQGGAERGDGAQRKAGAGAGALAGAPAPVAAPPFSRDALQSLMWECAGVVRDAAGLERARDVLASWRDAPEPGQREPRDSVRDIEDANLLLVATHLVDAALARRDSVGAHVRADRAAPETAPETAPAGVAGPTTAPVTAAEARAAPAREAAPSIHRPTLTKV